MAKWNHETDSCSFGSIKIGRVVDIENSGFAASMLYPDSTPERIRSLSKRFGSQHIHPDTLDLYLSFHAFVIKTKNQNLF